MNKKETLLSDKLPKSLEEAVIRFQTRADFDVTVGWHCRDMIIDILDDLSIEIKDVDVNVQVDQNLYLPDCLAFKANEAKGS